MSLRPLTPRISHPARPVVPMLGAPASGIAILIAFGLLIVGTATIALVADDAGFRLFMGSCAVLLLVAVSAVSAYAFAVTRGVIRVDAGAPALRFAPPARVRTLFTALGVAALLPVAATLLTGTIGDTPLRGGGVIGLGVLAVIWIGQQLWSLRVPRGLTLSELGLAGVRGTAAVSVAWSELAHAEAVWDRGAKLVIHRTGMSALVIEPRWTGSDPNLVALIVTHYLEHPEDRGLLGDAEAAVRRVEGAAAAD